MPAERSLAVKDDTWKNLKTLQLEKGFRSMDELLSSMIQKYQMKAK
jgi:hypothetical protein